MKSPHPPSRSKLKAPAPKTLASGRRIYPGSFSDNLELSNAEELEALRQLRVPIMPSNITISGRSPYDPTTAESVRRLLSELEGRGLAELVKNEGWRLTPKGLEQSGLKPLAE